MITDFEDTSGSLSETLRQTLAEIDTPKITLRHLFDLIGEQGLLFLCAMLAIPFLLPISIPGLSSIFGPAIILIAAGITANRLPWLPKRLMRKELDAEKIKQTLSRGLGLVGRIERFIRPRFKGLTAAGIPSRINGAALIFAAILLMAPFGLIPFSNTLPAFAILLMSIGMTQRDGLVVIVSYLLIVATLIYLGILVWLMVQAGQGVSGLLGS
ncbi:exopolysaccharide biosynthesis protein [Hyphomonas sp. WL0036]|uniref:exopolysaccharide biosynthesis protein n=1 Tax=Hyphomonas sediminis TaxID=2866160 RepID=UPI001C80961E|nr:exopolysaccharide biosynthesis protein [Hyphomonas sediminis]